MQKTLENDASRSFGELQIQPLDASDEPHPRHGAVPSEKPPVPATSTHRLDGGLRAYASLLGGFCVTFVTFGYVNAFGVYQDVYTRAAVASASRISWIGSTQLFFLLFCGLFSGKLLDMGYFRHTLLVGSVIYVFSLFMVSLAHHDKYYQIFLSQGLGMGVGAGLLYVPAIAVQGHHWRARRAFAMGVVVTGSSIGGIVFPIMLNQLFKSSVGFAWGVRASAFLVLGLLVVGNLLMRDDATLRGASKPRPDMKGILTDVPYMLGNFAVLIIDWGLFFPYFYLQLYAILQGVDSNAAFYTLAVMNGASLPGRTLPTLLADKIGPFNTLLPCSLVCTILLFSLFGIKSTGSIFVFAALYGFFSGAFLALCGPTVATLARDPSEIGARFGLAFCITAFGALSGTPVDGALLGGTFEWHKAIIFSGVTTLMGTLMILVQRWMVAKRKGTVYV